MGERTAFHLRGGDHAAVELVDAWLHDHGLRVSVYADPFAACASFFQEQANEPTIAFIGADWLAADEFLIVEYARQAWRRTPIIVYGTSIALRPLHVPDMAACCMSRAALRRLLSLTPDELVRHIRPHCPGKSVETRVAQPSAAPQPTPAPTNVAATAQRARAIAGVVPATAPAIQKKTSSHASLTRDELRALLGED